MRDGFLLDPDVVYLNHGGYGACPVGVFEEYQRWQRELERQPTDFFARRLSTWFWEGQSGPSLLHGARAFSPPSSALEPRTWSSCRTRPMA